MTLKVSVVKILSRPNILYSCRWHCSVSPNYNNIRTVQSGFDKITSWFSANRLSLNVKKITTMLSSSKWSPYRNFDLDIQSGTDQIESADTFKYFRIHLDNFFNFENYIDKITKKSWPKDLAKYLYLSMMHLISTYYGFMMGVIKQRVIHYKSIQNTLWGQ